MDRRRYLALLGAAASVAGCSGGGDETTTEDETETTDPTIEMGTDTDTPTETATDPPPTTDEPTETATATETETETPEEPAEEVRLRFAAAPVESDQMDAINEALHAAGLAENVTLRHRETGTVGLRGQAREWMTSASSVPDLIVTDAGWTRSLLRDDLGVRLEQQAEFPEAARNRVREGFSATVDTVTNDGGALMAVPLHVSAPTVAYRTDLFEQGGYPRDSSRATSPMTWQAFADAVNDVQNQTGVSLGFGFGAERYDGLACCLFNEVLTSWGGAYFGRPDRLLERYGGRPVTAGNEPARNAMAMLRTFMYDDDRQALNDYASDISSPEVLDWQDDEPVARMVNGNAASIRARTEDLATLAGSSVGSSVRAMPLPYAVTESEADQQGAGGTSPSMGGWNVIVNPRSRNVSAAARAAAAMTTDDFRLAMLEQANFVPPRASLFSTSRARNSTMGPFLSAVRFAAENAIPRPSNRRWYERMSDVVEREVHDCLAQEQNPGEAAQGIESRLRRFEGSGT